MLALLRRFGAVLALLASFAAAAATIPMEVNDNADYASTDTLSNDPGVDPTGCTLRKVLHNIKDGAQTYTDCPAGSANPADDYEITFQSSGTIQIGTMGDMPDVSNKVKVTGHTSGTTISGNTTGLGLCYIFRITGGGELTVEGFVLPNNVTLKSAGKSAVRIESGGTSFSANHVTFDSNLNDACCGGAILASTGTINLANVNFVGNTSNQTGGQGGAIHLSSTGLNSITDATFTSNEAADDGGAIWVSLTSSITPATLEIINSTFQLNKASGAADTRGGGAIRAKAAGNLSVVSVITSAFIANEANGNDGRGGAIFNDQADGNMVVDHAVFTLNTAATTALSVGGAIYSADNMVVRASSFIANDAGPGKGGAFAGQASAPSGLELGNVIANSTMQGNTAASGGAVYSFAQSGNRELKLINVTIDGNTATASGGGIFTENIGGGTAFTRMANTIVSNNGGGNCAHVGNPIGNPVNNIVGNLQWPAATCDADVPITTGDPKLDPPFINPPDILTLTMALQAGSAALRGGDVTNCTDFPILNLDQRSLLVPIRNLPGNTACDIGAYESSREPGYGSAPGPGSTITINTFTGVAQTSNVVISETGDDHLTITSYGFVGSPEITISNLPAAPFNIDDGAAAQTLIITCNSGVPTTSLTGTLTVNHNATGSPATYTVNCIVVDPLVITTATPLASHTVNVPGYSQTLAAAGGTAPYNNWIVTLGALPTGLSLDPGTGAITGMPTAVGTSNFTVQVSDSAAIPLTATKAFSIDILAAPVPPTITTASPLPGGTTGTPYPLLTFAATGGTPPYTLWAFSGGTPPPGLSVAANGDLTGTPTVPGVYNFDVTVTDSTPLQGTKSFQLTVVAPPIVITTASPLPGGTTGTPYPLLTFAATGGTPPYTMWAFSGGTPPPGLSVAANGDLTGTPTLAGVYNFDVTVTDSLAQQGTKAFQLTVVAPPLVITTASPLPGGTQGVLYSQAFAATGGTPPYVNWVATIPAQLPPGLSINPVSGALSGTPTTPGVYNFTVQVSDSAGVPLTTTKGFSVTIVAPLSITTATPLPTGAVGTPYSLTFAATGGTPPYVNWIATVPAQLPPGLSINPVSGALTGTPTLAGVYNFTVQVSDSTGVPLTTTKGFSLTITAGLAISTPSPLPAGTQGVAYSLTFAAVGGTPPYVNWIATVPAQLPPGLTINPASGALTGTPTLAGVYNFTVQVSDSAGAPATTTKAFSLTINAPLTITTASPLPAGTQGVVYSQTFAATGGTPPYVNWIATVPAQLPPGLTINAGSGALTGTPTLAGVYNFTVQVSDSTGVPLTTTKAFSLTINPPVSITTATPLPVGTVGTAYNQTFAATGGTPGYSNWIVTVGTLPAGLTLNPATGALAGTPTLAGTSNFTVQVQDSVGTLATKAFALTINPGPLTIVTASPLPGGSVGTAYSQTFTAAGGTPGYSNWIVTVGTLPAGLTLNPATGALTGTPTTPGTSNFTVQVQDSLAATTTKAFALTISGTALSITTASPLPGGTVGTAYSLTFAATGGTPAYSNWIVTVGSLPPGLALAATTGALTGTPTTAGTYNFTVQVQDSVATTATKAFALTIGGTALSITTASPLPGGTVGAAYNQTFAAAGGTPPYVNWVITVPAELPPGLSLNASSGALTGTPTTAGVYNFTVQVSDSAGVPATTTKAFALTVAAAGCFTGAATSGNATACLTGGGATCNFTPGTAQFIPLTGHPSSPPAGTAPSGIMFPHGLFAFTLSGCTPGATISMTVTYPSALPPGAQYWKYGPTPSTPTPGWYILPATFGAATATFSIVDGGLGDDDLLANGTVVDQGGPGVPGAGGTGAEQTPTLSEWAMVILALLILAVAGLRRRRPAGLR